MSRPNLWAVDRPDLQHDVRVCSKSAAKPTADELLDVKRIGRYVKGSPHIGIMFAWQKAPMKLTVQSDSDWAGERKTRKSVSSGNIRFGHHLLRSWSKDHSVIAQSTGEAGLYATCKLTSSCSKNVSENCFKVLSLCTVAESLLSVVFGLFHVVLVCALVTWVVFGFTRLFHFSFKVFCRLVQVAFSCFVRCMSFKVCENVALAFFKVVQVFWDCLHRFGSFCICSRLLVV